MNRPCAKKTPGSDQQNYRPAPKERQEKRSVNLRSCVYEAYRCASVPAEALHEATGPRAIWRSNRRVAANNKSNVLLAPAQVKIALASSKDVASSTLC